MCTNSGHDEGHGTFSKNIIWMVLALGTAGVAVMMVRGELKPGMGAIPLVVLVIVLAILWKRGWLEQPPAMGCFPPGSTSISSG